MNNKKLLGKHLTESLYMTISSIAEGVISVDKKGKIMFINPAAQMLTGWDECEAIGQSLDTVINIINGKTREKVECNLVEIMNSKEKTSFSYCSILVSKSDSEKYISINITPIMYDNGQVSGAVITLQDVTCHRQVRVMEENLRRSRDFYLTLFDEFPAMIWRSKTDKSIDYVNKKWLEFTGSEYTQVLGDGWTKRVHPDDIKLCVNAYRDSINKNETFEIEYRIKRYDGVYRWIVDRAGPYYNLDGNFAGYIGACYDITEQKQASELLKKYELLSEKTKDIIMVNELNGKIIEANEAAVKIYGYNRDEILSKSIFDLSTDKELTKLQLEKSFEGGVFFEDIHCRKDGSTVPVEVSSQGTVFGENKVIISIIRDVEERIEKRIQVELEMQRAMEATKAAYKAKSEFLANMSHEIRTPLNGILGMIDLTMLTKLSHDQMDNLSTAKNCANSLLKVINDVLDFSKMEAGKLSIEQVEFDFQHIMEKIVKVHYYNAKEKGIELTYQLPIGLPDMLIGDANRLQQVLNNLLSNAVKFTDRGHVSLIVRIKKCEDNYISLNFSVIDTGIGISTSEMDKLFISFSQIDGSRTRRFGGTGLGLVISRQLIEMMGGTLEVESEKDRGSIFSFSIEFGIGERKKEANNNIYNKNFYKSNCNAKILLVEDDKVNQTVISMMLKEMGHEFDIADSGNDALKLLEFNWYDLCLMDIQMPGLDGIQTVNIIRQNEQKNGTHMPIIAITAHALQGDREHLLAKGMDEYIAKPFQMSELFLLIEKFLIVHDEKDIIRNNTFTIHKYSETTDFNSYIKSYAHKIKPVINEISICSDKLRHIVKVGNMQETEDIAHEIKTLASSISADKIKTFAFRIELTARRGNHLEAIELFKDLDEVIKKYLINISEVENT